MVLRAQALGNPGRNLGVFEFEKENADANIENISKKCVRLQLAQGECVYRVYALGSRGAGMGKQDTASSVFVFLTVFFRVLDFRAKLRGRSRDSPLSSASTHADPPPPSTSPPGGAFVITDDPAWTPHPHPESIVDILGFTLGVAHSMGLDECIITCIHYYNVVQGSFTALKICAPPVHPPLPTPDNH